MKIIKPPFTPEEINIIKGTYANVAKQLSVTPAYVRQIAIGAREVNTDKAKDILDKLQSLLNVLNS